MVELARGLSMRPMEIKRKLPVSWANEFEQEDGSFLVNFAAVNHEHVLASARDKLCGLCGLPLSYWIAFLGGPLAARARTYGDPPMHEACAQAAINLCPHIADQWVMGLTRQFEWKLSQGSLVFHTAPFKHIRTFSYDSQGKIKEDN